MTWLKKNWSLVILIVIALLDLDLDVSQAWYVAGFTLVVYQYYVVPTQSYIATNRIMGMVLANALLDKGVIDEKDLSRAQNRLVGNTPIEDLKKLKKMLEKNGIHLEDYMDEELEEVLEEDPDISIFSYLRDLEHNSSDSFIKEKRAPYKDKIKAEWK